MEPYSALHDLTHKLEHLRAARYHIVAPVAVLYFDWLLTISLEIDRFWRHRITGPTVLFLINRYVPILAFIPTVFAYFSDKFTPEECRKGVVPFGVATNIVSQSTIALILALRTYALYQQSRVILVVVSMAWAAATAIGAWGASAIAFLQLPPGIPGVSGCVMHAPDGEKYRLAAAYAGSLIFDAVIYALTLWKSYTIRRARPWCKFSGYTLLDIVVRDGSIYFFVLLGSNILSILLICLAKPDLRVINATFNHIIPVAITSRLLLNLRHGVRRDCTSPDVQLTTSPDFDFLTVVLGNIGESFEDDDQDSVSDDNIDDDKTGLESIEMSEQRLRMPGSS